MRCAGLGKVWVPPDEIAIKNECRVGVKTDEGEKKNKGDAENYCRVRGRTKTNLKNKMGLVCCRKSLL